LITELTEDNARVGSTEAVRLRAEGFSGGAWGAFVGVHFLYPDSTAYDASGYCGIHFYARRADDVVAVPDSIEIRVPDYYTVPAGGHCIDLAAPAAGGAAGDLDQCYDHHAKLVVLTAEWKEYTVYFSELHQGNWPGFAQSPLDGIDLSTITSIEFFLNRPDVYEIWVDDLSFIVKPQGGECP
jgi:hypothetical protein